MGNEDALFLCFYGDGPMWDNVTMVPGFPSGCSYLRSFRYRDSWIQNELREKMKNGQKSDKQAFGDAVLCMRFINENNSRLILPVRMVTIEKVDPMPDNQSVYFRMGPLYDFTKVKTLTDACMTIVPSEQTRIGSALFFEAGITVPRDKFTIEREDEAWVAYADLIAKDSSVSINPDARRSLFIRLKGFTNKEPAKIDIINASVSTGKLWGTILGEGESYELVFYHRIPCMIDQNKSVKKSSLKYKVPSGNIELSTSEEELTGNYQKHMLNVSALKPSGTWEEIVVEPQDKIESQDGATIILTTSMKIGVKVKLSQWYRFKRTYAWLALIWATLFLNVLIGHQKDQVRDWGLIIASAVVAVGSAMGVYALQQRSASK